MSTTDVMDNAVVRSERLKVRVKCRACGQEYVLRGTLGQTGNIETGFKMCVCENTDVEMTVIDER